MDTTQKYIDMCIGLDAIEPTGWKPKLGDKFYDKKFKRVEHIGTRPGLEFYELHPMGIDIVWLPRQDDIQERLDLSISTLQIAFYRFSTGTARLVFSTFEERGVKR